jgi:hypothetical protein
VATGSPRFFTSDLLTGLPLIPATDSGERLCNMAITYKTLATSQRHAVRLRVYRRPDREDGHADLTSTEVAVEKSLLGIRRQQEDLPNTAFLP